MPRVIKIESCKGCPHNDHMGAFGRVAYVPICRLANKSQSWEPVADRNGRVSAHQTVDIPEWCPLDKAV